LTKVTPCSPEGQGRKGAKLTQHNPTPSFPHPSRDPYSTLRGKKAREIEEAAGWIWRGKVRSRKAAWFIARRVYWLQIEKRLAQVTLRPRALAESIGCVPNTVYSALQELLAVGYLVALSGGPRKPYTVRLGWRSRLDLETLARWGVGTEIGTEIGTDSVPMEPCKAPEENNLQPTPSTPLDIKKLRFKPAALRAPSQTPEPKPLDADSPAAEREQAIARLCRQHPTWAADIRAAFRWYREQKGESDFALIAAAEQMLERGLRAHPRGLLRLFLTGERKDGTIDHAAYGRTRGRAGELESAYYKRQPVVRLAQSIASGSPDPFPWLPPGDSALAVQCAEKVRELARAAGQSEKAERFLGQLAEHRPCVDVLRDRCMEAARSLRDAIASGQRAYQRPVHACDAIPANLRRAMAGATA